MKGVLRRAVLGLLGGLLGCLLWAWRLSCRRQAVDDPRPRLRQLKRPYVMALLHAQQMAAVLLNDEARLAAMVSRSTDGDVLARVLRLHGVQPVRGSSRRGQRDKGGLAALRTLHAHVRAGGPALLAVDGPRGPRGQVGRGILALARACDAVILPVAAEASRRSLLRRSWDRFEIPWPGCRLRLRFGTPVQVGAASRDDPALRQLLASRLRDLEAGQAAAPVAPATPAARP